MKKQIKLKLERFKIAKLSSTKSILGGTGENGTTDTNTDSIGLKIKKCKQDSKVWE